MRTLPPPDDHTRRGSYCGSGETDRKVSAGVAAPAKNGCDGLANGAGRDRRAGHRCAETAKKERPRSASAMPVSDADEYRASARDCLCKAEKASYPEDKQVWMDMAETWLGMIPASERTPEEMFEKAVREQATQQDHGCVRW
jgi:hypothetical protein